MFAIFLHKMIEHKMLIFALLPQVFLILSTVAFLLAKIEAIFLCAAFHLN